MKAYGGSGSIPPRILDLGTRWRWVVSFTPRPLYPQRKRPWYPLGELQSRFGRGGEKKNSQPLPGLEPPIIQPVAQRYSTELSRAMLYVMQRDVTFLDSHPYNHIITKSIKATLN
jgi:hypothetical protein